MQVLAWDKQELAADSTGLAADSTEVAAVELLVAVAQGPAPEEQVLEEPQAVGQQAEQPQRAELVEQVR